MTKYFGNNTNVFIMKCLFINCYMLTHNKIGVKNLKHPSSIYKVKLFQKFFTPLQFSNYNYLSFLCCLGGKSSLPLINCKVKVVNSCVNSYMNLKKYVSKVVGSRIFPSPSISKITGILLF